MMERRLILLLLLWECNIFLYDLFGRSKFRTMEKKSLFILTILVVVSAPLLTQAQTAYEKTFGGINEDWAQTAVLLEDSSFIYTGITYSWGNGGEDFLMVKTDKHG